MSSASVQTSVVQGPDPSLVGGPTGSASALYAPGGLVASGRVSLQSGLASAVLQEVDYASTGYPSVSLASLSLNPAGGSASLGTSAGVCVTKDKVLSAPLFTTYSGTTVLPAGVPTSVYKFGQGQKYPGGPPVYGTPSGSAYVDDGGLWSFCATATSNILGTVPYVQCLFSVFPAQSLGPDVPYVVLNTGVVAIPPVSPFLPTATVYSAIGLTAVAGIGATADDILVGSDAALTIAWTLTRLGGGRLSLQP